MTIRETLTDITGVGDRDKRERWHDALRFQREVMPLLPRQIQVVELPPGRRYQFNCFAFALSLRSISSENQFRDGFIYAPFVEKLIADGRLTKRTGLSEEGDIVFYRNKGSLKHAGRMADSDTVISKWSGGPVLRHPLLYVPGQYGDEIEYYESIQEQHAKELFAIYRRWNRAGS
jgi:hypothetical protein